MYPPVEVAELDAQVRYSPESRAALGDALDLVADVRLEEERRSDTERPLRFYLRAMRHNRREITRAIFETRFWRFSYQFGRLTTAAASTVLILLMTAESWDLAMSQQPLSIVFFSATILIAASAYVLNRQRIFVEPWRGGLTEQRVISRVSLSVAMLLGMTTTYLLLFGAVAAVSLLFFPETLIRSWATSIAEPSTWGSRLRLAGFIAAFGIAIGALGATFEPKAYFRHVAFIDEET